MNKTTKIIVCICIGAVSVMTLLAVLFVLWCGGVFNKLFAEEIVSFESPDGNYLLVYQQLGNPEFPFGKTDVRLTLKDRNNKRLDSIDTEIHDDGASANEGNVKSVEWTSNSVIVTLQASEMPDKEIELMYGH